MSKKVILVEDDLDDRELFVTFFSHRKDLHLLPPVANGLELIEALENTSSEENLPDLIILDQNMPKMNGKQTLSFLKSHKRFSEIPAVVYSTYADSTLVVDCKKLGAEMVAIKPIDHDGYQKMMNDFLQLFSAMR
jgi:CheY-like chemotaxis protein